MAERPGISSEIRAWMLASVVILAHTVTITWWAATISADMQALRDSILRDRAMFSDHELRIRTLEGVPKPR